MKAVLKIINFPPLSSPITTFLGDGSILKNFCPDPSDDTSTRGLAPSTQHSHIPSSKLKIDSSLRCCNDKHQQRRPLTRLDSVTLSICLHRGVRLLLETVVEIFQHTDTDRRVVGCAFFSSSCRYLFSFSNAVVYVNRCRAGPSLGVIFSTHFLPRMSPLQPLGWVI